MTQGPSSSSTASQMFATPEGIKLVTSLVKLSEGLQGLSEFLSSAYLGDHSFTALEKTATAAEETPVSISKAVSISKEKTPESGAETEEKKTLKKEHKKRAPKDPNAPKHPTSAYLLFQNDQRATLKAEHAELSNTELMQLISSKWKAMTEEQRKPYMSTYESARENYKVRLEAYKKGQNGSVEVSAPVAAVEQHESDTSSTTSSSSASSGQSLSLMAAKPVAPVPVAVAPPATPSTEQKKKSKKKRASMGADESSAATLVTISPVAATPSAAPASGEPPKKKKKKSKKEVPIAA